MATESSEELHRHHAYMAYLLGHATTRLPLEADLWWRAAEGETELPDPLQDWRSGMTRWVEELLKVPVRGRRKQQRVGEALKSVLAEFGTCLVRIWGGDAHKQFMAYRDRVVEQDFDRDETIALMADAPHPRTTVADAGLAGAVAGLSNVSRDFCMGLPDNLERWAGLGSSVAEIICSPIGPEWRDAVKRLEELHSRLLADPLLQRVELNITKAAYNATLAALPEGVYREMFEEWCGKQIANYHEQVLDRLAGRDRLPPDTTPAKQKVPPRNLQAIALGLLVKNPTWTGTRLAQELDCSRQHLYKLGLVNVALKKRSAGRMKTPKGATKEEEGGKWDVEAIDEED